MWLPPPSTLPLSNFRAKMVGFHGQMSQGSAYRQKFSLQKRHFPFLRKIRKTCSRSGIQPLLGHRRVKLLKNSHAIVNITNIYWMPFLSRNILLQFLEKLGFIRFPQKAISISQTPGKRTKRIHKDSFQINCFELSQ